MSDLKKYEVRLTYTGTNTYIVTAHSEEEAEAFAAVTYREGSDGHKIADPTVTAIFTGCEYEEVDKLEAFELESDQG